MYKARVLNIYGIEGSGKTTLDAYLRHQLDVLTDQSEIVHAGDVCFIGSLYKNGKFYSYGGADTYSTRGKIGIINDIRNEADNGSKYIVIAGKKGFRQRISLMQDYEFYMIFNKQSKDKILEFRRARQIRDKISPTEDKKLEEALEDQDKEIKKWRAITTCYQNVKLRIFDQGSTAESRVKYLLELINRKQKYPGFKTMDELKAIADAENPQEKV